ncbi:hypothetical protein DFH06DRAFT_1308439 [Mycena polygramma]|nr:hypothetical protein DFH06DRAFT_1308439 [Mycena polygramma]
MLSPSVAAVLLSTESSSSSAAVLGHEDTGTPYCCPPKTIAVGGFATLLAGNFLHPDPKSKGDAGAQSQFHPLSLGNRRDWIHASGAARRRPAEMYPLSGPIRLHILDLDRQRIAMRTPVLFQLESQLFLLDIFRS